VADQREFVTVTAPQPLDLNSLEFSPKGERLWAMAADGRIFVWDLGALRRELTSLGLDW